MPAWSATRALGKSCAVKTVIGSFLRYRPWMVLIVTGFRVVVSAAPKGECELHRMGTISICLRTVGLDDDVKFDRQIGEAIREMFMMARDCIKILQAQKKAVVQS